MNKQMIEQKAQKLLNEIGYLDGELDVVKAANKLGFTVGISILPEWDDGFILIGSAEKIQDLIGISTDRAIGVNADYELQRKRFIIAHEIGHYKLHYHEKNDALYVRHENKTGKKVEENEADFFATCFLMPRKHFEKRYDELKNKGLSEDEMICLLQKQFNVPYEIVKKRMVQLERKEFEMTENFKMMVDVILCDEDIDDIMDAAMSGITYWCSHVIPKGKYLGNYASEQISRGGTLLLFDIENGECQYLTKEKFIQGFKRYLEKEPGNDILTFVNHGLRVDTGNIDAEIADVIIQYSLFDDIIYS